MKNVVGTDLGISLSLLIMLVSSSLAQSPDPAEVNNQPSLLTAEPLPEDPQDDELRKLLKARYNAAVAEMRAAIELYNVGTERIDLIREAGGQLLKSGLDLCEKPADKVALLTQYVELTRRAERDAEVRVLSGTMTATELYGARFVRLDAEIQLLRATRQDDRSK